MVKVKRERLAIISEDDCKVSVDRISVLPNEVLGLILSFLTLKEATATCILCRRWKYTWTLTRKLDLDGTPWLRKVKRSRSKESALHDERCKYVRWVDRQIIGGLHHHKPSTNLLQFKLLFDLNESHRQWIVDWLSYAVSMKVETLELNLIDANGSGRASNHFSFLCYNFPYKEGNFPNNLSLLKELSTHSVHVTGEAVAFLLRNCPLLRRLSVSQSRVLSSLEIVGTFPAFKCLEICSCQNLRSVVVRDSDVVCIKYGGERIQRFLLLNVPRLTQLWIKPHFINAVMSMFWPLLPQLEMLKIYFMFKLSYEESREIVSGVEMRNLKQLVVSIGDGYDDMGSLLPVINLITASPRMQRFVIEPCGFFNPAPGRWIQKRVM